MTLVDDRAYRFGRDVHWRAGARRNLALRGDRLVVPDPLDIAPLDTASRAEAAVLPWVDAAGRLVWLRPRFREFVARPLPGTRGVVELGNLDGPAPARRMVAGRGLVWVLTQERLDRYAATTRQRLTPAAVPAGTRLSDATGDGADGVWLTEVDPEGRWRLRHVDCWGRTCAPPIPVDGPDGGELAVAATGGRLVVVDPAAPSAARVVDPAGGDPVVIGLDPVHGTGATLLTATPDGRFHLLTVLADGGCVYEVLDLGGDVEDHQELTVPCAVGRPTALAGGGAAVVVAGARGLGEITRSGGVTGDRTSTFVTPALVSPVGPRAGWNRAELDVILPAGTAVDVTWAATDEAWLVARAAGLLDGPVTAGLVGKLDELLPWREDETVTYRGAGDGAAVDTLAALLDAVEETTLWLRIRLHTPPGRTPPELAALRVRYPDTSYLDHLPAIYRENPVAARDLRRLLAPYEVLFDGLDETLAALPGTLDPATAGDDGTDYLLGWLGFPPLGDLAAPLRRELLTRAPALLEWRGTRRGLQELLDVVTERRAVVADSAEEPVGWFLGEDDAPSVGAAPARLGRDTLVLAQRPEPARAGTMVVGATPLGRGCPDPELVLAQRSATVTVTVEADRERRDVLGPILDRLLPAFVPAHCRLRLVFAPATDTTHGGRLDVDFRLGPDSPARLRGDERRRLGATTSPGRWPLPAPPFRAALLDHGAPLGADIRLH